MQIKKKCVFLDRDGVINKERGDYTYKVEDFVILQGVKTALTRLKKNDYLCVVITNQAGISRGIYSVEDMVSCHEHMLKKLEGLLDRIYYCPYHPDQTASLCRKPESLMFEKAIAKFNIQTEGSWMIGDKERDLIPAKMLGLNTALIGEVSSDYAKYNGNSLEEIVDKYIIG